MFPEDRVLVGVINRKRDLDVLQTEGWYRIPQAKMPNGVSSEYVGFFLSRVFKERNGGIYYYGEQRGLELAYRKDLLPKERNHPRAREKYFKVQISELKEKTPPILNPTRRTIGFIYTTWDRFVHARQISDLYSKADFYVDRIYYALRNRGINSERTWSAQFRELVAQLRIECQDNTLIASTRPGDGQVFLDEELEQDAVLAKILAEIDQQGGPVFLPIPIG